MRPSTKLLTRGKDTAVRTPQFCLKNPVKEMPQNKKFRNCFNNGHFRFGGYKAIAGTIKLILQKKRGGGNVKKLNCVV